MRNLFSIIVSLGVVAAGCCVRTNYDCSDKNLPLVISQAGRAMVPPFAFGQLLTGQRSVIGQTRHRVFSINGGLANVRMVSQNPIVAATEQGGWFFYATSVATDDATHQPVQFISGYAIQRGSRQVIYWSTW
jgi:hypothetical protein